VIAIGKTALIALLVGYVLPSYSILRRMAEGRDDQALSTMKVEGSAVVSPTAARDVAGLLGVEWVSGELPLSFTASLRFPGRCRLELSSPESTRVVAAVSSNGKRRVEGGELPALQAAADEICAVLALRGAGEGESRAAVERHLGTLKVNRAATSLGRFRGTVAYVVGDPGDSAPQLWVYKDRFTPARVRFSDEKQNRWDIQFFDYTSPATGEWFPRVLLIQKGLEPVIRLTALKGDVKARLDDSLF
jgi:hypothetical protein